MSSIQYEEIIDTEKKHLICNTVLRSLPDWFGLEDAIVDYCHGVKNKPFFSVSIKNADPIGFVSLHHTSAVASEIYVMGILRPFHGQGIGKALVEWAKSYAINEGKKLLLVKTLSASHPDKNYAQTRIFYERVGFVPLEELPDLWGSANPCLNMVMFL